MLRSDEVVDFCTLPVTAQRWLQVVCPKAGLRMAQVWPRLVLVDHQCPPGPSGGELKAITRGGDLTVCHPSLCSIYHKGAFNLM